MKIRLHLTLAILTGIVTMGAPSLYGASNPRDAYRQNQRQLAEGIEQAAPETKKTEAPATTPNAINSNWNTNLRQQTAPNTVSPAKPVNAAPINNSWKPAATPVAPPSGAQRPLLTPSNNNYGNIQWSPNQPQKMSIDEKNQNAVKVTSSKLNSSANTSPNANSTVIDSSHPASYFKTDDKNLLEKTKENPSLSTFLSALQASGLSEEIEKNGPYTIFAPSNEAFRQLPKGTLERLLKPENQRDLYMIISYHIVPGKLSTKDAMTQKIRTLNGKDLELEASRGTLAVDDAEVIRQDVQGKNGVIHVIDSVLLPN